MKIQSQLPTVHAIEEKLREASQLYEKQFLRELTRAMRATVPENTLQPDSMATKIFQEQLDQHHSDTWGEKGGIGLADLIYQNLHERLLPANLAKPRGFYQIEPRPQPPARETDSISTAVSELTETENVVLKE